jgi:hypothetical protein
MIPLRPVSSSRVLRPTVICVWPLVPSMNERRRAPSRFEIIPPGSPTGIGMTFASPWRLSTRISPIAPAAFACAAFVSSGHEPRDASAIFPLSEFFGSLLFVDAMLVGGPQRSGLTGLPSVPVIVPTSTTVCGVVPQAFGPGVKLAHWKGTPCRSAGALCDVASRAGAKTCVLDVAATVIAAGAVPGEPVEPSPNWSRSFPAAMTGTTPASATLWTALMSASFAGSTSGPPPEKLITSIPSVTADSNAATISGVSASSPNGVGTVKTR